MLRRFHLFEFSDLPRFPAVLRRLITDYLQAGMELSRPFEPRRDLLIRAFKQAGQFNVVDLCSGGAGPWFRLVEQLREETGQPISVLLTDKFPDPEAAQRSSGVAGIQYYLEPVDALAVPEELVGTRTLINGLHHFHPAQVQQILQDAVNHRRPVVIFEALQRSWRELLWIQQTPLFVLRVTPHIQPFSWRRILLTYVLPISLVVNWWDAFVSVLRCYTKDELLKTAHELDGPPYIWEAGTYHQSGVPVTFLAGYPAPEHIEPGTNETASRQGSEQEPARVGRGLPVRPDLSGSS